VCVFDKFSAHSFGSRSTGKPIPKTFFLKKILGMNNEK